ncbi:MAG: TldD/PmbA family protein [Candidatus Margulisiibacteriota bacterium]
MKYSEIKDILQSKLNQGADFAEVFLENKESTSIKLEDNKIEHVRYGTDCGAGVRTLIGDKTNYSYTNDTDFRPSNTPDDVSLEEKVKTLEMANKTARAVSDKVKQVTVTYMESLQHIHIINSEGLVVDDLRHRSRFAIHVIAADGSVIQTGFEAPGCSGGFLQVFNRNSAEELTLLAARRAVRMLDAPHAPAGEMPVVLLSEAGGTMVHEACGHALEADFIMKEISVFNDRLGKQIASPLITVIDDGSIAGGFGSYKYDDEGNRSEKTVLIENGILKAFLTDRITAKALDLPISGNGRRESFRHRPVPRMSNTYIDRGKDTAENIIRSVDKGLLVKRMGGGQVDVTNGEFVFEVSEGYLIENGEVSTPVRGATIIGSGPKVLETVDMVANDHHFQEGVCGKYDHAPVSDAQPTIRIPAIIVGGRGS